MYISKLNTEKSLDFTRAQFFVDFDQWYKGPLSNNLRPRRVMKIDYLLSKKSLPQN